MASAALEASAQQCCHAGSLYRADPTALSLIAINSMSQGFAMFDAEARLELANCAYAAMYQLPSGLVQSGVPLATIVAHGRSVGSFDPRPLYRLHGRPDAETNSVRINQLPNGRRIRVTPSLRNCGGWVCVHEDVTAHEELQDRLVEQQNQLCKTTEDLQTQVTLFDAALANMHQGLAMFDANQILLVFNQRYLDVYGMPADCLKAGMSLREVIQLRIDLGIYSGGSAEDYVRNRLASLSKANVETLQQRDGRYVQIKRRPMKNGGWVTTHEDVTDAVVSERRIAHLAMHDALTDLPNRVLFRDELMKSIADLGQKHAFALHVMDLDFFKDVNDTYGHQVGDRLLQDVGLRLRQAVRDDDVVARMGGDEFAIIQRDAMQTSAAESLARRLIEAVSAPYVIDHNEISVGASMGWTLASLDNRETAVQLLQHADLALYDAKRTGRSIGRGYTKQIAVRETGRREFERDLHRAVHEDQFTTAFQPIVDARTCAILRFEALIRWQHPTKGVIPPDQFVSVAEQLGLIQGLGETVMRQAISTAAQWKKPLPVAVNVSPLQLMNPGFVASVRQILLSTEFDPRRLEIEITETAMLGERAIAQRNLEALRQMGISIALDDFGIGYSSLSLLHQIAFDRVKIDRSFMSTSDTAMSGQRIVKAMLGLCSDLGLVVTGEGVEREEQRQFLLRLNCVEQQGYHFSRPVTALKSIAMADSGVAQPNDDS
jgi:diguanylate cyclase (GGDEF)-like protein